VRVYRLVHSSQAPPLSGLAGKTGRETFLTWKLAKTFGVRGWHASNPICEEDRDEQEGTVCKKGLKSRGFDGGSILVNDRLKHFAAGVFVEFNLKVPHFQEEF
jgi:hypothetical protein